MPSSFSFVGVNRPDSLFAHARRYVGACCALLLTGVLLSSPCLATTLADYLTVTPAASIFPGADRVSIAEPDASSALAFAGEEQIGFVYLNTDLVNATGYSGKPIQIIVGLDMAGVIRALRLVEHHEPIVLIGIPEEKVNAVIDRYLGVDIVKVLRGETRRLPYDALSGATVTVRVIDDSIIRSSGRIARNRGLGGLEPPASAKRTPAFEVDMEITDVRDWIGLIQEGAVRRLKLTMKEVDEAFAAEGVEVKGRDSGAPDDVFIELYTALISVPSIGRSLLGDAEYKNLQRRLAPGQHAILVAANGPYSFKGSAYVRGGIFDRFELIQNESAIRFRDTEHKRLRRIAAEGAPDLRDVDVFRIPPDADFEAAAAWELELLVSRELGPRDKAFHTFSESYELPPRYLKKIETGEPPDEAVSSRQELLPGLDDVPLWQGLWRDKWWQVVLLLLAIVLITCIFFFQAWFAKRPRLLDGLRLGLMVFAAFGIGFYANAQLSVVNILTVFNALVTGFDWSYFLMEPLIFIGWGSIAAGLLFWGRGAYCGWLCPFGALQELLSRVAKKVGIPQYRVPWALHERLWPVKYMIFLALFGVSLHSLSMAEQLAEIEPFKTAIILKFARAWPFVLFAVGLLTAGLFIERFYCRYLCALGAALAIPGRLRMFEWLKRYRQCGHPCQICSSTCMVQAIHPEGQINPNECIYCLHCQQLYFDAHKCPVAVESRLKKERRAAQVSAGTSEQAKDIIAEIKRSRNAENELDNRRS